MASKEESYGTVAEPLVARPTQEFIIKKRKEAVANGLAPTQSQIDLFALLDYGPVALSPAAMVAGPTGAVSSRDLPSGFGIDTGKKCLTLNGGGLLPVASAYGILRAFKKKGALNQFHYILGISGGMIATSMYCFADEANYNKQPNTNSDLLLDCAREFAPWDSSWKNGSAWDDLGKLDKPSKAKSEPGLFGWVCTQPTLVKVLPQVLMLGATGPVARLLSCQQCTGWDLHAFASNFVYEYFLKYLGIPKNKMLKKGVDGVYPNQSEPLPLGLFTMTNVTDMAYDSYVKAYIQWTVAAKAKALEDVTIAKDGWRQLRNGSGPEIGKDLRDEAGGISQVPWVGGPDGVYTGYTASETVPFMNFKANLDCCTKCAKPGCFCQPKPLRVNQNAASPEDAPYPEEFVLKTCKPFGPLPTSKTFSAEVLTGFSADFFEIVSQLQLPCPLDKLAFSCTKGCAGSLKIKTNARDDKITNDADPKSYNDTAQVDWGDGGVMDATGIAGAVMVGCNDITAMISQSAGPTLHSPSGPLHYASVQWLGLASLFGVLDPGGSEEGSSDNAKYPDLSQANPLVLNQIFDNAESAAFDGMTPYNYMVDQMYRRATGQLGNAHTTVCKLSGLKICSNYFWGTDPEKMSEIDLTIIIINLPGAATAT